MSQKCGILQETMYYYPMYYIFSQALYCLQGTLYSPRHSIFSQALYIRPGTRFLDILCRCLHIQREVPGWGLDEACIRLQPPPKDHDPSINNANTRYVWHLLHSLRRWYILHYTVYTVHCIVYIVPRTVYTLQCNVYTLIQST